MTDPRVLVDARSLTHPTAAGHGIGNYTAGLLQGLQAVGADVIALVDDDNAVGLESLSPHQVSTWDRADVMSHLDASTWFIATGLFLHPVVFDPIPRSITDAAIPVAAVLYDVIPYQNPSRYLNTLPARRQAALRAPLARTVDVVFAISDYVRRTGTSQLQLEPARVITVGAGVGDRFRPPLERAPCPSLTVVAVTGADQRKNTERLLAAWSEAHPSLGVPARLIIVAAVPDLLAKKWRRLATDLGVANAVSIETEVSDDELVSLLQHADLAVQPSIEEGFGLPVVEAAACGCPVIASNTSALAEVLDAVATFDPLEPADIAHAIRRALLDPPHRELVASAAADAAARWTWPHVARRVLAAIATGSGPSVRPPAIRIGFAGAAATLAGDVAREVERSLAAPDVELEYFLSDDGRGPWTDSQPVWPLAAFGARVKPHDFDAVVAVDEQSRGWLERRQPSVPVFVLEHQQSAPSSLRRSAAAVGEVGSSVLSPAALVVRLREARNRLDTATATS